MNTKHASCCLCRTCVPGTPESVTRSLAEYRAEGYQPADSYVAPLGDAFARRRIAQLTAERDRLLTELADLRVKTFNGTATEALAAVLLTVGHDVGVGEDALMNAHRAIVEVHEDFTMGCKVIRAYLPGHIPDTGANR